MSNTTERSQMVTDFFVRAIAQFGLASHVQNLASNGTTEVLHSLVKPSENICKHLNRKIPMSTGKFVSFVISFSKDGVKVRPQKQADDILQKSRVMVSNGAKGVAITYSANYGQTREIERVYFSGGWNTQTNGANQAAVMSSMESLLSSEYKDLQGKMQIVPITTMNAYVDLVDPWNHDVLMGIVTTDLERIKIYLEGGWDVLGWQNQNTVDDPKHPYAIGGGVAKLPPAVSDKIQTTLIEYAKVYVK